MRSRFMMHGMIRWLLVGALLTVPLLPASGAEPEPARLTIVDYFRSLPDSAMDAVPTAWLATNNGTDSRRIIDKKNGYLRGEGDGGQPNFECALFRYSDERPLLALCQGELEGSDSVHLDFFVSGPGGQLRKAPRSIFPVEDGAGKQFILPREGRTVIVREKSGRHERRFTWDGARFVEKN